MGFKWFGFAGEDYATPFGESMFYDSWMPLTFEPLFLGFEGQTAAKSFERGRFRDEGESFLTGRTRLELLTQKFDSLFLGFDGQPTAKTFGWGRFRDEGEAYGFGRTRLELLAQKFDSLFLGFDGQPTAKPFDTGRFRDLTESYGMHDTRRDVADIADDSYGTRRIVIVPDPEPDPYTDHVERMRQHLISQFQWDVIDGEIHDDKPVLRAILTGLGKELDELDAAVLAVKRDRSIERGVGVQLDGIGEIVGQSREARDALALKYFGFYGQPSALGFGEARFRERDEIALANYILSDPEYRTALLQKISKNIAAGTAEDTIASLKSLFNAPVVFLNEAGNANIGVSIGRVLQQNEILLANALDLVVRAGGVGLRYKGYFNYNHYFGFLGQLNAKGFGIGSLADIF